MVDNALGGKEYSRIEERLLSILTQVIRNRDKSMPSDCAMTSAILNNCGDPRAVPRPKDYMALYVKAAAVVYEAAIRLSAIPMHPGIPKKSPLDWVKAIVGFDVKLDDDFNENITTQVLESCAKVALIDETSSISKETFDESESKNGSEAVGHFTIPSDAV